MAPPNGWIKLHRKVLESGIIKNHRLWAFWCWCLLKATHHEIDQVVGSQIVHLLPGQLIFGRKVASIDLNMTERQVRTSLNFCLNVDRNMTIQPTNKFSILTIVNWDTYQHIDGETDQQTDQQTTSKRPANDHKQECKEGKECKEKDIISYRRCPVRGDSELPEFTDEEGI